MEYRREIDGLRAVAVLPVILFHAGFSWFAGGYVGVDIFFVISGYLITTIIINDIENRRFSIAKFYERRARRILPALFFVLLCCIPFAWMWMVPSQFKDFSQALVAIAFFSSNILFWRNEDYFAPSAEENPLLHTWSLGVEEQFYIFFPLLLLMLWRFGRQPVFYVVCLMSLVSFLLSEWGWRNNPEANFYLLPTRAWELGVGAICAFILHGRPAKSNQFLSLAGLLLVLYSIFAFDETIPFPSAYALVPVVGTALIIIYGSSSTLAAKILSLKWLVGIGLVSFSAYLWHQPLLAFARIRSLTEPSLVLMFALSVASVVLAFFSWKYIEQPFRSGPKSIVSSRAKVFALSFVASVGFVAFGVHGHIKNGYYDNWMASNYAYADVAEFLSYRDTDDYKLQFNVDGCFFSGANGSLEDYNDTCLDIREGAENYVLMGDSHAAHLYKALREKYTNVNLSVATASGCKPLYGDEGRPQCTLLHDQTFSEIEEKSDIVNGVILSARWDESDFDGIRRTVAALNEVGVNVVIVGPTVEYSMDFPIALIRLLKQDADAETNTLSIESKHSLDNDLKELAASLGVGYVSVIDDLCSSDGCRNYSFDREPMQFDYGHLTLSGARTLVNEDFPGAMSDMFLPR